MHLAFLDMVDPRIREEIGRLLPAGWQLSCTASNDESDREAAAANADIAMIIGTGIDRSLLEKAPKLRFVQKLGAGVDNVDPVACQQHGVGVARLQAGNAGQVAEHTIMLMLAALRRLPYFDSKTREGRWLRAQGRATQRQLAGKTVGIIGLGAIGKEVARRLAGFDVDVIYYDIRRPDKETEARLNVRFSDFPDLLSGSDIVSLHTPLTAQTLNMLDARHIDMMKPGATIVNCARGGLIDEDALRRALDSGTVFAAGLDTFSVEPLRGSPLLDRDEVVLTPHLAGATLENFVKIFERGVTNIELFLSGQPLPDGELCIPDDYGWSN
ncbi:NAD(P)-dependent oxidoreductase [Brucella cytisi]|uniref:NAD(P)-dependent oxidoreductase n=1 Tax=Brucella cytisi TaxID=407152 RepID=UPI0035E01097